MSNVHVEEHAEGVRLLRVEHGKANTLATPVLRDLIAALDAAEKDANAVVITGREGMFSAGFDLATMQQGPEAAAEMVKAGGHLALAVYHHPKPIVAAVGGHAIAMGLFLAMVCDYRVATRGAFKLQANETAIGMTLPDFGIEFCRAAVSKRHYDRIIVQAEPYDPERAVDAGMVDEVVDAGQAEARAVEVAMKLGALPQPAYRNNKRMAHRPTYALLADSIDANVDGLMGPR